MYSGMWPSNGTWAVLFAIIAVIGWALIEGLIWLFSFVHVSLG